MKQTIFTLLLITVIGLISCRKNNNDPDIRQYDDIQIQNYIKANGLTNMKRDPAVGDTTGIYYEILSQGDTSKLTPLAYSDSISFVFTLKSFDNKYNNVDTVNANHFFGLLGHLSNSSLPRGLQLALHDLVRFKGSRAHLLIPSRMAYGVNGFGSGSSSNVNTRIAGNQCLDYYVNIVSDQNKYEDYLINDYMKKNNLTGFTPITSGRGKGMYVKVTTPGSGTGDAIGEASSFTVSAYTTQMLNDVVADPGPVAGTPASFTSEGTVPGFSEGLKGQTGGAVVSFFIPSRLAYAQSGSTGGAVSIGINVPLYFKDVTIVSVDNP